MADTHDHGTPGAHDDVSRDTHGHEIFRAYMVIAVALGIFTAASFVFNYLAHPDVNKISRETSFVLILSVAVVKATLVGMYFMHLKFEWGKLYFMIIPAFILGFMMMVVLLPDIVFVWSAKP
jgi:cytochrome c oxidase subunit 4